MTPSVKPMTSGQTDKAVANYRAMLEKHAPEFESEAVQAVLGRPDLASKMFAVFRALVEALSNLIIHIVKVNRGRTPQEALDATGRVQYTDKDVVATMPRGEGEEAEVIFFNIARFVTNAELDQEYELRGLKPADVYSLAAVNEADRDFAKEKPNGTQWKDAEGKYCFATFRQWGDDERRVSVYRDSHDWCDGWWFAGLRK